MRRLRRSRHRRRARSNASFISVTVCGQTRSALPACDRDLRDPVDGALVLDVCEFADSRPALSLWARDYTASMARVNRPGCSQGTQMRGVRTQPQLALRQQPHRPLPLGDILQVPLPGDPIERRRDLGEPRRERLHTGRRNSGAASQRLRRSNSSSRLPWCGRRRQAASPMRR